MSNPVSGKLLKSFPFEPTPGQAALFSLLEIFLLDKEPQKQLFMLKGYAGTGKTTTISTLVKNLVNFGYKSVLLAPTGRAAKVMGNYSGRRAYTIHKKIYSATADPYSGKLIFARQRNLHKNTIFIIDEASMIGNETEFGSKSLLHDLIEYVCEEPSNKIILVGDTAQLPPVGMDYSPALDTAYLKKEFNIHIIEKELTEVTRQQAESGILMNATRLREILRNGKEIISFKTKGYKDVYRMTGEKLEDGILYAYKKYGYENAIILCRSNKTAVQYNQYIRRQIKYSENEIDVGDLLMIVKNNYSTLDEGEPAGFLANGDFVEILKIISFTEMHGFRFADVKLRLTDYEDQAPFEAKIFLDTLHSSTPSLSREESNRLYESVIIDYADIKTKKEKNEKIRADKFLNALQVKFAYALTCHKSQGGQWPAVFVDQGYLTEENINTELVRWLYTACTRAREELFLMNFNERFFE